MMSATVRTDGRRLRMRIAAGLVCLAAAGQAAAETVPDFANNTASGDWDGRRSALYQAGVSCEADYKIDLLRRLSGAGRGSGAMGNLDLKLRLDLERLWAWEGTSAYVHVLDDRGAGFDARHLGSLMGVSNIEVPVPTARVFHAWVQRTFAAEEWALLAGLYPIDAEFATLDSAGILLHPAYGATADLALTRGPSIFNNSAFGVRLKWQAQERTHYAMGAVLDGMPGDPAHPVGTHIRFGRDDGYFAIAELGWTPIELGHAFEPVGPARMQQTPELRTHEQYEGFAKLAAGLWRYSHKVADQFDVDARGVAPLRQSHGAYLLGERTLFGLGDDPSRHLTAFGRYAVTDGDSTAIRDQLNLGIALRGPSAERSNDQLALGWTSGRLARKYRAAQWRDRGNATARSEDAVELSYRIAFRPWLAIQPDLQRIRHPGGGANARGATVAGCRLEIQL